MNITDIISEIDQDGYSIVRELITGDRLKQLQEDSEALLINIDAKSIDGGTIQGRMHKGTFSVSRGFDDIIIHPVLLDIVRAVLNPARPGPHEEALTDHIKSLPNPDSEISCNIMIKDAAPREDVRSIHRDLRIPVPRPHRTVVCNSLLALDRFTVENGATCVVPGSHKWESNEAPGMEKAMPVLMNPGDIVIFDGLLWHGHFPNCSFNASRKCLNLNYHYRWIRNYPNPKLPDDVWQNLSEELRKVV